MDLEGMDDPFKESWKQIERKKLALSDYKEYRSFRLRPIIVKANDDLRQEVLAM
jgi:phosphatidylinositol kinase/protein kinase (PI-3  family)